MIYRRPGRALCRGERRARRARRAAQAPVMTSVDGKSAFPEDHPLALGSGGIVYTGHGRHFLDEATSCSRRLQLHAAQHHDARRFAPARRSSTPPTTRAISTRHYTATCRSSATPSWCSRNSSRPCVIGSESKPRSRHAARRSPASENEWLEMEGEAALDRTADQPVLRDVGVHARHRSEGRDRHARFRQPARPAAAVLYGDEAARLHRLGQVAPARHRARPHIGAKIAAPDKFCVNFMGDAAFGMTGLDFETAVRSRHSDPDDRAQQLHDGDRDPAHEAQPREAQDARSRRQLRALARDLGGWSERVDDPGEIGNAILRARQADRERPRRLLEFITSAETAFSHRRGALE